MSEIPTQDLDFEQWLHAASYGNIAFVDEYLHRGFNVNATRFETNTTALMMAVRGCHIEMIRLLLDHGADLGVENSRCFTAVTYGVITSRSWACYWDVPHPDPRPLELLL